MMTYTSAQRTALRALHMGALRLVGGSWLILGEQDAQEIPYRMVRWLLGEQLIDSVPIAGGAANEYRLSPKGERIARETARTDRSLELDWSMVGALAGGPLLLLAPAPHSEDLDHALVVTMGQDDIARHRDGLAFARQARSADPEHFEFIQYRTDVFALPINNALIGQGLLPPEDRPFMVLEAGLAEPRELGARWCPDRGVNYGADYVQWFGGFEDEDPLIVSPRLELATFEEVLREAELGA